MEAELLENGFDKACVDKYLELFKGLESAEDGVAYLADTLEGFLEPEIAQSLREIMDSGQSDEGFRFRDCVRRYAGKRHVLLYRNHF